MENTVKKQKTIKDISAIRLIVFSFLFIVLLGATILYMPFCARGTENTSFVDSLFTAASATCVTGLAVFDTFTKWNAIGQAVILLLIQLGGLGIITFTTGATMLLRGKLDIRDLQIAKEQTNGRVIEVSKLIQVILWWTLACESLGALLLSLRFVPRFGVYGIWQAIFSAVSAYCNAGFEILGFISPGKSFSAFVGDPLICLTISFLIISGGLGFIVISDLGVNFSKKIKHKNTKIKLKLHSILVLIITAFLLILGTVLFFIFENNNTLKGFSLREKIIAAFFQSTNLRTAGFFSVPIGSEYDVTKILSIILMFIGASPASTGGGIKTTTFLVIIIVIKSVLQGREDAIILKHKVPKSTVYKALSIVGLSLLFVTVIISLVYIFESPIPLIDVTYEVVSAFSTTGLSTGLTPHLTDMSKLLLAFVMFVGRVGPISIILAVTLKQKKRGSEKILPDGQVVVG
ncbi:MAG: hypothetical protein IJ758_00760 [Clostridia bacterium]|nr:hypothetical protein [Clostridia bacterium]